MEISNNQSYYINPNTRTLTCNLKNTAVSDYSIHDLMSDKLRPVEDMMKVLKTPINLASSSRMNRQSNSVDIAAGTRITINDGYVLTVKPEGVELSNENNSYNKESYLEAQGMAGALASLLRNAGGTMNIRNTFNNQEYGEWTESVSKVLGYMGIDASKDFTVNGMMYSKNEAGYIESSVSSDARAAYEKLKANNRTYEFADDKTKKQIEHMTDYYLKESSEALKTAWRKTLEETGINPFPIGYTGTMAQLSIEQDFATGGDDLIFGNDVEENIETVMQILDRLENPVSDVPENKQSYVQAEKEFYTDLLGNLQT